MVAILKQQSTPAAPAEAVTQLLTKPQLAPARPKEIRIESQPVAKPPFIPGLLAQRPAVPSEPVQRTVVQPGTVVKPTAATHVTLTEGPFTVGQKIKSLRGVLYKRFKGKEEAIYPKFQIEPVRGLLPIATKPDRLQSMTYPLIKPFAYARIEWDAGENALVYSVVEPALTEKELYIFDKLREGLMQVINISLEDVRKHDTMTDFLEEHVRMLLSEYDFRLDDDSYLRLMYFIYRNFVGLNEMEPFLRDPYIEDIGVDGIDIPVYIVHQKFGSVKTNIIYHDEKKLKEFITKLAERCDRYISYAEPLLDGSLPDGTRVHASLASDVTTRGPTFSIRKFKDVPFTPVDMVHLGTASAEMLAYLWFVVEHGSNVLITGGVSTGKTSLLNCLSLFIPPEAKIVSIEDTRELALPHENWVPGVARSGFTGTGIGEVSMFDLLKESFRQNPDFLIVGEIRGKEAYVMFQSMASGHPSMSTMHAGSVDDVIKRLQTEPINLSPGLMESLDMVIVMVHAREKGKSSRRIKELIEIESIDSETGRPRTSKVFVWLPAPDSFEYRGDSWLLHKISTEKGLPINTIIKEIARRKKLLNWMTDNNVVAIKDIVKYIALYYRNPESIRNLIGEFI